MVGDLAPGSSKKKQTNCQDLLKDMSSSELTMIHRLSGNDPQVRKKTMRKLSKWLMALAGKVSDLPESRTIIEPNFIRVWKALFYCMWMSDKPLAQEQLAEQISNLVHIFAPKPHLMCLFIEWFLLTMSREWSWIDRFRMDKYMMLVRRFLRKVLSEFAERGWNAQSLSTFVNVITINILNRGSPTSNKAKPKTIEQTLAVKAPLGFQIHFIDIFMEELSKIGGENLKKGKVLKLITPFIKELSLNDDDRILDELKERIFHHLMNQSDVAIDYQESKGGKYVFVEDENGNEETDEEFEEAMEEGGPLDPRAGAVDVVLPQLQIDYDELANKLIEVANQKGVKMKNRKLLYNLARQFKEITEGKYPLAIVREDSRTPAIPRKELKKATDRLLELDISDTVGTRRKTKRERKREALRVGRVNSNDSLGSEDNSAFLQDDELLDHVSDNYMSYLEDEIHNKDASEEEEEVDGSPSPVLKIEKGKRKRTKREKTQETESENVERMDLDVDDSNNGDISHNDKSADETVFVIKKRKTRSSEAGTNGDVLRSIKKTAPMKAKKQAAKKSPRVVLNPNEKLLASLSESVNLLNCSSSHPQNAASTPVGSPKRRMRTSIKEQLFSSPNESSVHNSSTPLSQNIFSTPVGSLKRKMRTPKNFLASSAGLTPTSSTKKKVCFILAKNLEHEHSDYKDSIQRSPAIPYSATKRPSVGLLKSPRSSLSNTTPRRKAAEYF